MVFHFEEVRLLAQNCSMGRASIFSFKVCLHYTASRHLSGVVASDLFKPNLT